ncbi:MULTISPECIES: SseB family protein [Crateriforma]|uniref:SseB protein N-terminal domain-containing protein n=1 Tax=Crateriforma conspicua TaxID=2527996 RepID=A0A5C6FP60_9PLAN|nr:MULTISPECIES: SseB family protein [Crateriforma]QDV65753.1 hypothetical protein Mal65_49260 [Crateriforma conspicua]TWT71153.1 hypothetical protein Pan14r_34630 [Crateriforma conspicua]TWU64912.1 hypothetical protein V7x_04560 [Crateriforma conspicua]
MVAPLSDDAYADFVAAIADSDVQRIQSILSGTEFILISVEDPDEPEDSEEIGALTAELEDQDVLVVFSSESHAEQFVNAQADVFEDIEEVQGFTVGGELLMDYLPDDYGILINPETDDVQLIDADIADQMRPPVDEDAS